jgi:hypothetical protein
MKTSTESTKSTTENTEHNVETIEDVRLEDVTGGCVRCGCGTQAGPNLALAAFAATLQR